jgi:hypothetical protein
MNDSQFDDFVNDKLNEYAAPVPAGLWEKVAEGQFDQFIGGKLKDNEAPVPDGLWNKIADHQFDHFVAGKLHAHEAPVPAGLWDKVTDGQFDHFVAGKFTDHEAPVPVGLWEKIRPEEDDNRRVGFILFRYPAAAVLILAILTAAAWGGYTFFTSQKKTAGITQIDAPVGNQKESLQTPATTNHGNALPPVDAAANASSAPGEKTDPFSKKGNSDEASDPVNRQTAANLADPFSSRGNTAGLSIPAKKEIHQRLASPPHSNNVTDNAYDIFKSKTAAADNTIDPSLSVNDSHFYTAPFQRSFVYASTVPFGFSKYTGSSDKALSTLNHTRQFKNVIICPTDRRNTDWYLEAYASPDVAIKSVSNISATSLYMLKKDSSEHMQVSYSAGLRLVKPITNNILLKAGIQYSQANEKYVYRTENEVKTTTVVTVRTIIRAPGDTVVIQDTSVLQTIGFRNNTVKNRYRSFDIPVSVGYQFGNDDLKFGINAGVIINVSSWYQGVILDTSLATVTLNKSGNMIYKSNVGLGLYGSISVVKRLSDEMHVFVEPYFRYNLSNITTAQAPFTQKFSLGGLAVGLRFNLNRK